MLASVSRGLRVIHSKAGGSLKDTARKGLLISSIRNNSSAQSKPVETKTQEMTEQVANKVEEMEKYQVDEISEAGTSLDNPVLIPATSARTIVGCRCKEYSKTIFWFYLDEGDPQLCDCGVYFKLDRVEEDAPVPNIYKVMSVNKNVIDNCPRTLAKRAYQLRANKLK